MGRKVPGSPNWQGRNARFGDVRRLTQTAAHARAETVARAAYGQLIAMFAARSSDIIAAEDALSDALVAVLRA